MSKSISIILGLPRMAYEMDLVRLAAASHDLVRPVYARNTVDTYASDWRQFLGWCSCAGLIALPATPDTVLLYITWMLVDKKSKITTAEHHLASVMNNHRRAGRPFAGLPEVRKVISSVRRLRRERPIGRAALAVNDLVRVVEACPATILGRRDHAILVLGFGTSFRRSELARLHISDVTFDAGGGLVVLVRFAKTDQDGHGRTVGVWPGERASTDPVGVLRAWLERRGDWDGPLFSTTTRKPISGEAINELVKRAIARAGIDPKPYGAHSLRAGAITAAAEAGGTDQEIMNLSGHASATVMRTYIRRARVFSGRNPLAGVL